MDDQSLRLVVAILTAAFVLWIAGFAVYSTLRNKTNAIAISPHKATLVQKGLLLVAIILDGYLISRPAFPALDRWVLAQGSPAPWLAIALMAAGGGLMVATQLNMGASWRIGVPNGGEDIASLVSTGPHSFSRNPIYLGIMVMIAGAALAAPGPLTIVSLIVTFLGLQSIIAEEETYLAKQFGDDYEKYSARVRRWL